MSMRVPPSFSNEVKTFVSENKALTALTLGVAAAAYALGNLAGRMVSWLSKCMGTSAKTDIEGRKTLAQEQPKQAEAFHFTVQMQAPHPQKADHVGHRTLAQPAEQETPPVLQNHENHESVSQNHAPSQAQVRAPQGTSLEDVAPKQSEGWRAGVFPELLDRAGTHSKLAKDGDWLMRSKGEMIIVSQKDKNSIGVGAGVDNGYHHTALKKSDVAAFIKTLPAGQQQFPKARYEETLEDAPFPTEQEYAASKAAEMSKPAAAPKEVERAPLQLSKDVHTGLDSDDLGAFLKSNGDWLVRYDPSKKAVVVSQKVDNGFTDSDLTPELLKNLPIGQKKMPDKTHG